MDQYMKGMNQNDELNTIYGATEPPNSTTESLHWSNPNVRWCLHGPVTATVAGP